MLSMKKIVWMNYKLELIKFYESKQLDDMLFKICENTRYRDDLKQDLIIYLLTLEEKKITRLIKDKELLYYSYGYLKNQYHSSTSEFFKTYRNFVNLETGYDKADQELDIKDQMTIIKVDKILDEKINWFDAFLFRKYYYEWWDDEKEKTIKGRSYRKIESEYTLDKDFKMDHMYVFSSVKTTMNIVKKELGI